MGPTWVDSSRGSPTTSAASRFSYSRTNSSWTSSSTMMRLAAMHDWPALMIRMVVMTSAACSRSASARTIAGSEPPSSSTAGLISAPATDATADPARSDPVSDTARTRGSRSSTSTSSWPAMTPCMTPSGAPTASSKSSAIACAQPGTCRSCFMMHVLPAISAGARNRNASQNGAFHGSTPSTGPSGRCCT
jgi:hypothetical protein